MVEANRRITTHKIRDLWRKAVPMFPSYAAAVVLYIKAKIRDGAIRAKNGNRRTHTNITVIKSNEPSQKIFSAAANRLGKLVTSAPNNGLNKKVKVV